MGNTGLPEGFGPWGGTPENEFLAHRSVAFGERALQVDNHSIGLLECLADSLKQSFHAFALYLRARTAIQQNVSREKDT